MVYTVFVCVKYSLSGVSAFEFGVVLHEPYLSQLKERFHRELRVCDVQCALAARACVCAGPQRLWCAPRVPVRVSCVRARPDTLVYLAVGIVYVRGAGGHSIYRGPFFGRIK